MSLWLYNFPVYSKEAGGLSAVMGLENSQLRKVREDMVNEVINYVEKRKQLSFLPSYDTRNTVMFN